MNRWIGCYMLVGFCFFLKAQNFSTNERYFLTELVYNPAVAGSEERLTAVLSSKRTWMNIPNSPRVSMLNLHVKASDLGFSRPRKYIGNKSERIGVGIGVYNDRNGLLTTNCLQLSLAYHLPVSKETKLGFGIAPKFYQCTLREDQFIAYDPTDPDLSLTTQKTTFINLNAGLFLHNRQLKVGLSTSNPAVITEEAATFYKMERIGTYYFSARYKFSFVKDYPTEPMVVVRHYKNENRIDLMLRQTLGENFYAGVGYASKNGFSMMLAIRHKQFSAGYLLEITNSPLAKQSGGNHMFFVAYNLFP